MNVDITAQVCERLSWLAGRIENATDAEEILDAVDHIRRMQGTIAILNAQLSNVRAELQRQRSIEGVY